MQQLCSSCAAVIERDCGKSEIQFILSRRSVYAVANNHRVAVTASGPREAVDTRLRQMDR
jgi:ribonuclease PH